MPPPPPSPSHFGFFTLRNFSTMAFSSAVEPLRMANYLTGREVYRWSVYSLSGEPAVASNGLTVMPTQQLDEAALPEVLFLCGGINVPQAVDTQLIRLLRRVARHKLMIGALCTGSYALAEAGLLDGYRCAIHWESLPGLRERYPRIEFSTALFVIDRDRCTCTGGIAPLDMVLEMITPRVGKTIAAGISEEFIVERVRSSSDIQHIPLATRLSGSHPSVAQAAALMETNIEDPLSLEELARLSGISNRQLQRLFRRNLGITPAQYYTTVRLRRARELLRRTTMPVMDVTVACGFSSACHFSRSYRTLFGHPPSQERNPRPAAAAQIPPPGAAT